MTTSNEEPTQVVRLEAIPTWQIYFERNETVLVNRQPSKGVDFKHDADINSRVSLYDGDITCLQVDGIVSANNSNLATTGGVSAAIEKKAGQQLTTDLKAINGCQTGETKLTPGYNLPAKFIIHTVGPQGEDPDLLENCYKNCLHQMQQHKMKSLAFCCISTGLYGYPKNKAVIVALKTVRQWMDNMKQQGTLNEIDRIIFCQFTPAEVTLYENWMQIVYPCCQPNELDLFPLPGYVTITLSESDMLGLDDGRRQAKMPCGHVIGPDSITDYCRRILAKGGFQFFCPSNGPPACNVQWEYFIVRHVARLTPEELSEFERKISENYVMKAKGMQRCPGCRALCYRGAGVGAAVRCPMCTKSTGRCFDFCWWCGGTWQGPSSTPPCGNPGCEGIDRRLSILSKCPKKKINTCENCPTIRGCPRCGILIEHRDRCAHMACTNCGDYGFCFICLKEKQNGMWQCSPWNGKCVLQPCQTVLPGST